MTAKPQENCYSEAGEGGTEVGVYNWCKCGAKNLIFRCDLWTTHINYMIFLFFMFLLGLRTVSPPVFVYLEHLSMIVVDSSLIH